MLDNYNDNFDSCRHRTIVESVCSLTGIRYRVRCTICGAQTCDCVSAKEAYTKWNDYFAFLNKYKSN